MEFETKRTHVLNGAKGPQQITLAVPSSMTFRYELVGLRGSKLRAYAACLAACWPSYATKHKEGTYAACGYSVPVFGGVASDWLLAQGVPPEQIIEVGQAAHALIAESLPTAKEIDDARGNSEAGEAPAAAP